MKTQNPSDHKKTKECILAEGSSESIFASMYITFGVVNPSKFNYEIKKKPKTFHYVSAAAIIKTKSQ